MAAAGVLDVTVFRSRAERGEGTSNPDQTYIDELEDDREHENWIRISWWGEEYRDAWILDRTENVIKLREHR